MLDILSDGFRKATDRLRGIAVLTEDNIAPAMADIRTSLLDADVEYGVVKDLINRIKEKAVGTKVNLTAGKGKEKVKTGAGDHFVKICLDELTALMGPVETKLNLPTSRIASVMMVGLQGSGKTTTTAKIASYLKRQKRKPLLVAADVYRPAAIKQLQVLGAKLDVPVFSLEEKNPVKICQQSWHKALDLGCDVLLFDTAGRLSIDEELMLELAQIKEACKPDNILLVCDAMMGQDAVTTAKNFNDRLKIDGVVITKLDGDTRGGAALSIKEVTGAPIKFLGLGEDLERLEEFRPEGLASRILGMGDIVGLMEDYQRVADGDKEEDAMRMLQGQFTFKDFYEQISMIQKMGSLKDIMAKLPMQNLIPKNANIDESELSKTKSMIDSMTEKERLQPDIINQSRIKRIAGGSGRSTNEVSALIKRFTGMRSMMGSMGKNLGMMGKIPGLGNLAQMNKMRQMMQNGPGDLAGMMPSLAGDSMRGQIPLKRVDKDKLRKARKTAKNNRKKNRKK